MTLHESCIADNAPQRQRLQALVSRLTDDDLRRAMPNGSTIADALTHLAFWDEICIAALEKWCGQSVAPPPLDADIINAAVQRLAGALPPRAAAHLALDAANRVDDAVASLSPEFVSQVEQAGRIRLIHRALHRKEHLDRIESL